MKVYGETDIRRQNWGGLRAWIKAPLYVPIINKAIVGILRRLPNFSGRARIPVVRASTLFRLRSGKNVTLLDPHRCSVARNVFWAQGRLPSAADMSAIRFAEYVACRVDLFLDIGAYSGLFSLVAARANQNVKCIAFEILPSNYILLLRNVIANDLHGQIDARLCALGSADGELTMPIEVGLSNLPTSLSLGSVFSQGVRVAVTTLDEVTADFVGKIAIKIDVEGYESEVFSGGKVFLKRFRPDIICEVLMSSNGAPAIEEILAPLGYNFYLFTDTGLIRRETIEPSKLGRDWLLSTRNDILEINLE